jgi:hypothetical protein
MYVKLQIATSTINLQHTSPNLAFVDVLVTSQPEPSLYHVYIVAKRVFRTKS